MTWTINGIDPKTYGFRPEVVSGWRDAPARSRTAVGIPGVPGERALDVAPQEAPRRLTASGLVIGTSAATARTNLDVLIALLSEPSLSVIFADQSDRAVSCELESMVVAPPAAFVIARKIPVTVTLIARDPYAYDVAAQNIAAGTGGTACPLGTGPVRPVLTLTAAAAVNNPVITVRNSAGATIGTIGLTVALALNDVVVIDCAKRTITLNGVSRLDLLTSGDFVTLDIATQGVYRTASWPTIARPANTTLSVVYKKAWR
jgi:phage-related protein